MSSLWKIALTGLLVLGALTGCGSSSSTDRGVRMASEDRDDDDDDDRYDYRDESVRDVAAEAARLNAGTGYVVADATLRNAEGNFASAGNPGIVPVAFVGERSYPLIENGGKFYLVSHTKNGPQIEEEWTGQVAWVSSPRALIDARVGTRVSTQIERDALALKRAEEISRRQRRRDAYNDIRSVTNDIRRWIP